MDESEVWERCKRGPKMVGYKRVGEKRYPNESIFREELFQVLKCRLDQPRVVPDEQRIEIIAPICQPGPEAPPSDCWVFEKRPNGNEFFILIADDESDRENLRPGVPEPCEHPFCGEEWIGGFGLVEQVAPLSLNSIVGRFAYNDLRVVFQLWYYFEFYLNNNT